MVKANSSSPLMSCALLVVVPLLLFFLIGVGNAQSSSGGVVPAIITFGDSTADVGNNNHLRTMYRANFLPYGKDFVNHQPTGRFCNGKLPTDITADALGFTRYPPAYLSTEASGENLLIGASFASAASGYYDGTSNLYNAMTLRQQLAHYKEYQSKLVQMAGRSKASSIISEALYVLSTGNGDFLHNYYINPQLHNTRSPDQFSSILVGNFSSFIQGLYVLGARRIGVTSLPPLGCLPMAIARFGHGSRECVSNINADAVNFNSRLKAAGSSLSKQLPELKIVVLDIYTPLYELITNPSKYGFLEARQTCCSTGDLVKSPLCNPDKLIGTCSNATSHVFWDGVHPSEAANQVIADALVIQAIKLFV